MEQSGGKKSYHFHLVFFPFQIKFMWLISRLIHLTMNCVKKKRKKSRLTGGNCIVHHLTFNLTGRVLQGALPVQTTNVHRHIQTPQKGSGAGQTKGLHTAGLSSSCFEHYCSSSDQIIANEWVKITALQCASHMPLQGALTGLHFFPEYDHSTYPDKLELSLFNTVARRFLPSPQTETSGNISTETLVALPISGVSAHTLNHPPIIWLKT